VWPEPEEEKSVSKDILGAAKAGLGGLGKMFGGDSTDSKTADKTKTKTKTKTPSSSTKK
jgi:hypothetical protein